MVCFEQEPSSGAAQACSIGARGRRSPGPSKTDGLSRPVDRVGSRLELVDEFLQLFWIDVADGEEFEAARRPSQDVEPLHRVELHSLILQGCAIRNKKIDHVLATPIDDRSNR